MRVQGSGNIGATNVFRVLGKPAGYFVLFVDALKGFLACSFVPSFVIQLFPSTASARELQQLFLIAGVCAVLGHNFTCWLKFKGGKGIATSAGVLLAWVPLGLLATFATWLIVFFASKYVSLASLAAALVLPFTVWLFHADRGAAYVWITAGLSTLAIYKHRSNIQRLLNGTEHRFDAKDPPTSPPT